METLTPPTSQKATFKLILAFLAILLVLLPFVTTFNEFLTNVVMKVKLYRYIQNFIVPFEAKMITVVLRALGIQAFPTLTSVNIGKPTTIGNNITISWNCIGWQSFILLVISLVTGLQGPYQAWGKIQVIITGICGTFLINIFRITLAILLAHRVNPLAGLIFHDYFSTVFIILWLFFFWWYSYTFVLERKIEEA